MRTVARVIRKGTFTFEMIEEELIMEFGTATKSQIKAKYYKECFDNEECYT